MEAIFLGTGSMVPTVERNHSAVLLTYKDEAMLFDCGEGTQRQLRIAKISPSKITRIFISHWHGDHILGLPGLIQTMGACDYKGVLEIYGPKGTNDFVSKILGSFVLETKVEIKSIEIEGGRFLETENFYAEALPARHSTPCLAYALVEKDRRKINMAYLKKLGVKSGPILKDLQAGKGIEWKGKKINVDDATFLVKGKKMAYVMDTKPCDNLAKIAKDADLLICEATLLDELREKADFACHMTSVQAAELAKLANAKKLVMTHFSQRYKSVADFKKEAKAIFPNSECAKDFLKVDF